MDTTSDKTQTGHGMN